ncbi:hypothetical protein D9M70_629780 [compost metagenome]
MNDTVTACSWPWWLTEVGPTVRLTVEKADSGTSLPVVLRTDRRATSSSNWRSLSAADRITW